MRSNVCRFALRGAVTLVMSGGLLLAGAGPAVAGARPAGPLAETACSANTCQVIDSSGDTVSDWYTETTAPSWRSDLGSELRASGVPMAVRA